MVRRAATVALVFFLGAVFSTCKLADLVNVGRPGALEINPLQLLDSARAGSTAPRIIAARLDAEIERLAWTARIAGANGWLSLSRLNGATPDSLALTLDPRGLAAGTYRDTLVFTVDGAAVDPIRVPVEFRIQGCSVLDLTPPVLRRDTLTAADCGAPHRPGSFARLYSVTAAANDSITVGLGFSSTNSWLVVDSAPGNGAPPLFESDRCGTIVGNACLRYVRLPRAGMYVIEATTSTPGAAGDFFIQVTRPRPPELPDSMFQERSDRSAVIALGGALPDSGIGLRASLLDLDGDSLRIEVEVRPTGTGFTNTPTASGPLFPGSFGTSAIMSGLSDDIGYHWQARAVDVTARAGPWRSFGANAETVADFTVSIPQSPPVPTALAQSKSDGVTAVAIGGTTDESAVLIQATLQDPDPTDQVRLEVEVQPLGTAFTDAATSSSPLVARGAVATATIAGLADNVSYHWQVRAVDQSGRTSGWTSFGGNAETTADFRVALAPSRLAFTALPGAVSAGSAIAPAVVVAAQDAAGNTIASFTGSISIALGTNPFGGTLSGTTSVTAAAGVATFSDLRLDRAGAGYTLLASLGALSTASAALTVTPGAATQLAFTASPAGGPAGVVFAPQVQVTARDSLGNRATGFGGNVTVGLAANPAGGALAGTLTVAAVQGIATFGNLSIARAGAGYALGASATGLAGATSATFTVSAGTATQLGVITEPSATGASGVVLARQPVVQLRDAQGNDVGGASLAIVATIASGPVGGTLAGAAASTAANGRATFSGLSVSGAPGTYTLAFNATGLVGTTSAGIVLGAGTATRLSIATQPSTGAASGVAFLQQPVVRLLDASGNGVAQAGVTVSAAIATGGGSLGGTADITTDASGVATYSDLAISGTAGTRRLTFTATGLTADTSNGINVGAGAASQIAIQAGNGQSAVAGSAVATPPAAIARDASGNPVAGVPVTFAIFSGGGAVAPVTAVATDGNGIATSTSWTLGATAGPNSLRATATGLNGSPLTFTATGTAGAAVLLTKTSGDNLSGEVGTILGTAHEVTVTDANGNPVSLVAITWAAASGGGSVNPTNSTTDVNGRATSVRTLGTGAGPQTTTAGATLAGGPATVTFNMSATVGGPTQMLLQGGDNQVDTVGATLATPLAVRVLDALNNPVANVLITWGVTDGGGATNPLTSSTNAQGIATTFWTLGTATTPTDSTQSARATGVGAPVNFIATSRPGNVSATRTEVVVAPASIVASSGTITSVITVTARDRFDNPIANRTVALAVTGNGAVTQPAGPTSIAGIATGSFSSTEAGPHVVTATVGGTLATAQPTITVTSAAPAALVFLTPPGNTSAGAAFASDIQVEVRDAFNNRATTSADPVTLALVANPGGGALSGTLTRNAAAGVATFPGLSINRSAAGYTIGASSGTLGGVISGPFTIAVGAISPATSVVTVSSGTVASGSGVTLTLQARDASGNSLTTGGSSVAFAASGGTSTGAISAVSDNGDGSYTATFTGVLAGSATTISATIGGAAVTTAQPTVTVTPGPISTATSLVSLSGASVPSGGTVTLRLRARDAAGNDLATGGAAVAFTTTNAAAGTIGPVTDSLNGVYVATFTAVTAGATSIGATVGGVAVTTPSAGMTVTAGGAANTTSLVAVSAGSVASGSAITLTLTARDAAGNALATGGETVVFSAAGGGSTGAVSGTTDNNNGTYSATFTGILAGSATQIQATINGNLVTSQQPVTVVPGAISTAGSQVTVSAATVASADAVTLTLLSRDAAGNAIAGGGQTVVFTAVGGTSTGTIGGTTDVGDGSYTATFTGALAGSATTINASINSVAVTSTLPTVTVTPGAISSVTSVVTVTSGTVLSGSSVTLTLTARDAASNALTAGGATVVFNVAGGTSTGVVGATNDAGTGTYTASFTGVGAGTATTVGATINTVTVTSAPMPTIQVTPGTISTAQSLVTVSSSSVASAGAVILTLSARDAVGNPLATGGETVAFTAVGGASTGTISGTTDVGDGTYTATFTGILAGASTTINASINTVAVTSVLPTVTVTPGAISAATSQVTVSSGTVASGGGVTLTLTARDAAGNNLAAGGETVAFTALGGTSTGTIGPTDDNGNGSYTATFTGALAGSATTINATINTVAVTSALPTVTVTPGAISPATSLVSVSSGTVVSGAGVTLTLTARDAAGNPITTGGETVAFTTVGGTSTGTIGGTTDVGDGSYTATFTGVLAGTATTINASVNTVAVTSALPTVTVTPGAISTAGSLVTVSSGTVVSGSDVTLTMTARDAAGNPIGAGGETVAFTALGGTSTGTIGGTTDAGNGSYTATFTGVLAGSATTINASINTVAVTSALPTVTVTPGAISTAGSLVTVSSGTVASGGGVTLTLTARDAAGNLVGTGGETVVFSAVGGSSNGTISATTDVGNGTYTATFTGVLAGSATTINATINTVAVTSALPTVTVTPGAISTATSLVSVSSGTVVSGAGATLTLTARDAAGNLVGTGGETVVFSAVGGSSNGTISATTDAGNGSYTATFTGVLAGSATTINATINTVAVTSALPTVTVTPGAISPATSLVSVSSGTVVSGAGVTLTLTARDAAGNPITTGGETVAFTTVGGTSTGTIGGTTDVGDGSYTATFTGVLAGTATTINASVNTVAVTSALPTVTVTPGAISTAGSLVTVSSGTVVSGSDVTLTMTARDAAGNPIGAGGETVAFTALGGTSTGTIGGTTDAGNGSYTATFTGVLAGSATTINASINTVAVTSTLPTMTVTAGAAVAVAITTEPGTTSARSGIALNPQPVIQLRDAAGNPVPQQNVDVAVALVGGGTLTGTTTVQTDANGVATFAGLIVSGTVGARTLDFTSTGLSGVSSAPFTLTAGPANHLVVTAQPLASMAAGTGFGITIRALDASDNLDLTFTGTIDLTLTGGNTTALNGTTSLAATAGEAAFTALSVNIVGTGYQVQAASGLLTGAASNAFDIVAANAHHLTFTTPPANTTAGASFTVALELRDVFENVKMNFDDDVVLTVAGGAATLNGTTTLSTVGGLVSFPGLSINQAGTGYRINADFGFGIPTAQSNLFDVDPAAADVTTSTVTAAAPTVSLTGQDTTTITLQVKDIFGNNLTTGGLTVVFGASTGLGVSEGTFGTVTYIGGGAYTVLFTGTLAGTPTTISATIGGNPVTSTTPVEVTS